MIKILTLAIVIAFAAAPVFAEGDNPNKGDFVSNTLSDVFDKLGKIVSGEKDVYSSEDEADAGYGTDPLGQRMPSSTRRSMKVSPE